MAFIYQIKYVWQYLLVYKYVVHFFFLMIISFTCQPGKTQIDSFIQNVSNEDAFKMNRLRNDFLFLERIIGSVFPEEKQCKFYVHEC